MFVAGADDVTVVTPAAGVEEAYDILVDGGVAPQKAADLAVGFARIGPPGPEWARSHEEMYPVFQARKFLRLRASLT